MKICSKCKRKLEATIDNFHNQKGGKFGLRPDCKECRRKYNKEHYKKIKKRNQNIIKDITKKIEKKF